MDCSSCGHPNREGARFCAQCATPLIERVVCPSCGTAHLALARVLLASAGAAARAEIEAALARALELARETGAKAFEPLVHVEFAELARQGGEEEQRERALREAHRLFTDIGATGHAERLAALLTCSGDGDAVASGPGGVHLR
jgi:hypothetical protein